MSPQESAQRHDLYLRNRKSPDLRLLLHSNTRMASQSFLALFIQIVIDHPSAQALGARLAKIAGVQIVAVDHAGAHVASAAHHFAQTVATRAFNVDDHGNTFMMIGALEQFMVQKPSKQSAHGLKLSSAPRSRTAFSRFRCNSAMRSSSRAILRWAMLGAAS
jgi:hypothetical protein